MKIALFAIAVVAALSIQVLAKEEQSASDFVRGFFQGFKERETIQGLDQCKIDMTWLTRDLKDIG